MFWGLVLEPNKRYTQTIDKPFHISQAAMDTSSGDNEMCQVMVIVEKKNYLICTLQRGKTIQTPIDLYFKSGETVSFLTNGNSNIHLTGYLDPEFEEDLEEEESDEEQEEEAPQLVQAGKKRQLESKVTNASKKLKRTPKDAEADSDDESGEDDDLKKLLEGDISSDEEDEENSFKLNTTTESDSDEEADSDDEEEVENGEEEEEDGDDSDEEPAGKKGKAAPAVTASPTETMTKSQKKRLKLKQKQELAKQQKDGKPLTNGVEKKADKKEKAKEEAGGKGDKKTLSGGVSIEEIRVGNGPIAKPGKMVNVYYVGKLKQNNKQFDACEKGPGFKFRLGAKEVIPGWEVGVAGMKVGGKRKIICPPPMAYGGKGSPPAIPPNSTLVFEVELKNVK